MISLSLLSDDPYEVKSWLFIIKSNHQIIYFLVFYFLFLFFFFSLFLFMTFLKYKILHLHFKKFYELRHSDNFVSI